MTKLPVALAALATVAVLGAGGTPALAAPDCTAEAKGKWLSEPAMRAKVAEMGFKDIRTFQTSGSCYEIYGYTADGKKAEVYFNPVTAEIVQQKTGG